MVTHLPELKKAYDEGLDFARKNITNGRSLRGLGSYAWQGISESLHEDEYSLLDSIEEYGIEGDSHPIANFRLKNISTDNLEDRLKGLGYKITEHYGNRFWVFTQNDVVSFYTNEIDGKNVPGIVIFNFDEDWRGFFDGVFKKKEGK
jgi:hypothetical protein